ncbi:hypothetical protein Dsin_004609 [Dipteronia sinensis]|uniref:ApaG domain-containing protein n=1 Tax=Dipteronia sinensis TaxID=43782 RepID=A0AAE0AVB5_9ROSI|nr:hypothetical protein Dsin_004609 [Dipteronia sinensis]
MTLLINLGSGFKLGVCTLRVEVSLRKGNTFMPIVYREDWSVISEQPVILPKTGFEYSSACPLSSPSGRMTNDKITTRNPVVLHHILVIRARLTHHIVL